MLELGEEGLEWERRREGRGKGVNERGREGGKEAGREGGTEGGRESNRMGGNYITSHDAQYSCVHVPKFHAQLTTKMLKTTHNTRYRKYMYLYMYTL